MNEIKKIYDKYGKDFTSKLTPASEEEIKIFISNCNKYNVPNDIVDELVFYYKQNNNFFNYFVCDDLTIFEWYESENKCLWLGQRDLWTFRCLIDKHKYSIGDAYNESFGDDYEFDTIYEMLDAFLSGEKI